MIGDKNKNVNDNVVPNYLNVGLEHRDNPPQVFGNFKIITPVDNSAGDETVRGYSPCAAALPESWSSDQVESHTAATRGISDKSDYSDCSYEKNVISKGSDVSSQTSSTRDIDLDRKIENPIFESVVKKQINYIARVLKKNVNIGSNSTVPSHVEIIKMSHPRRLPNPTSSQEPRASDWYNCENSCIEPFEWYDVKKDNVTPEAPELSQGSSNAKVIEPNAKTNPDTGFNEVEKSQDSLRLPRSYYNWFKSLPGFKRSHAAQYVLDSFSKVKGYLSESPQFDPQIFHNAGKDMCCLRPPPSVNSCVQKQRTLDARLLLESLPRDNIASKLNRWFDEKIFPETNVNLDNGSKPQADTGLQASDYYQTHFSKSCKLVIEEIPHLESGDMEKFTFLQIFIILSSLLLGGVPLVLVSMIILFLMWGRSSIRIIYGQIGFLGRCVEIFVHIFESGFFFFAPAWSLGLPNLEYVIWIKRFKRKLRLKFYCFLERFSTVFFQHSKFKTSILFHQNLRKLTPFIHQYSRLPVKGSVRRYRAKRLVRGKSPILQMFHLGEREERSSQGVTVPLTIRNSVPLIQTTLGSLVLDIIVDSGSPVNIMPVHLLKKFEEDNGYRCVRYASDIKLRAHNSSLLTLRDYGVLIPLKFNTSSGDSTEIHLPFLLEETSSEDIILGLPSLSSLDIHVKSSSDSTCTINLNKSVNKLTPVGPVPVLIKDNVRSIPSEIPIVNGLYVFSKFSEQTFHEKSCVIEHDPRFECIIGKEMKHLNDVNCNYLKTHTDVYNLVNIKDNDIELEHSSPQGRDYLPGIEGLAGTVELVSMSTMPRYKTQSSPRPEGGWAKSPIGTALAYKSTPDGDAQDEFIMDPDEFIDLSYVDNSFDNNLQDDQETGSSCNPDLHIRPISDYKPGVRKAAYLHFVTPGPSFQCLFSAGDAPCKCLSLKNKNKYKQKFQFDNRPKLIVNTNSDGLIDIFFCARGGQRISNLPKMVALITVIEKLKIKDLILDIPCHAQNPFLNEFHDDLKQGFKNVILSNPKSYFLYTTTPEIKPIMPGANLVNPAPNLRNIQLQKHTGLRGCDSVIPDEVLEEAEAFPFLSVSTFEDDLKTFLKNSGEEEQDFLNDLLSEYKLVALQNPTDLGRIDDPRFIMDIKLIDENQPLPLDLPFQTSLNKKTAASQIVSHWLASGIVKPSNIRTHASRLVVANKGLNNSDFKKIVERLKRDLNLDYTHLDKSEVSRINPAILSPYEVSKCYRICLDCRGLNLMTRPEAVCSANPDLIISELMSHPSKVPAYISDLGIEAQSPTN